MRNYPVKKIVFTQTFSVWAVLGRRCVRGHPRRRCRPAAGSAGWWHGRVDATFRGTGGGRCAASIGPEQGRCTPSTGRPKERYRQTLQRVNASIAWSAGLWCTYIVEPQSSNLGSKFRAVIGPGRNKTSTAPALARGHVESTMKPLRHGSSDVPISRTGAKCSFCRLPRRLLAVFTFFSLFPCQTTLRFGSGENCRPASARKSRVAGSAREASTQGASSQRPQEKKCPSRRAAHGLVGGLRGVPRAGERTGLTIQ